MTEENPGSGGRSVTAPPLQPAQTSAGEPLPEGAAEPGQRQPESGADPSPAEPEPEPGFSTCTTCYGTGYAPGEHLCDDCLGMPESSCDGISVVCETCAGTGRKKVPCPSCSGPGE